MMLEDAPRRPAEGRNDELTNLAGGERGTVIEVAVENQSAADAGSDPHAEEIGEAMLREDPAVRADFEKALADPAFAADPRKRLDFFYRRSPYWDTAKDVVPILRVDTF